MAEDSLLLLWRIIVAALHVIVNLRRGFGLGLIAGGLCLLDGFGVGGFGVGGVEGGARDCGCRIGRLNGGLFFLLLLFAICEAAQRDDDEKQAQADSFVHCNRTCADHR